MSRRAAATEAESLGGVTLAGGVGFVGLALLLLAVPIGARVDAFAVSVRLVGLVAPAVVSGLTGVVPAKLEVVAVLERRTWRAVRVLCVVVVAPVSDRELSAGARLLALGVLLEALGVVEP